MIRAGEIQSSLGTDRILDYRHCQLYRSITNLTDLTSNRPDSFSELIRVFGGNQVAIASGGGHMEVVREA